MTTVKRLVFVGAVFTAAVLGLAGMGKYADAQGKPGSSVIELCSPITVSANVSGVAPVPLGRQIRVGSRLVNVLKITSAGGAGTLDVYFQHSADDGQTWCDYAHVQSSNATGTWYIPVSCIAAGPTGSLTAITDGTSTAGTATQGPLGDRLRIKYSVASVGTSPWNFQAFVLPD